MPNPFPQIPQEHRGTLRCQPFKSKCLAANPWGDPAVRDLWIYYPSGFKPGETLPAILFLAGFGGTGEGMLARGLTDVSLAQRLDSLIYAGKCPPVIGVFPDCMSSLVGTQFLDSTGIGAYGSYLGHELASYLKENVTYGGRLALAGRFNIFFCTRAANIISTFRRGAVNGSHQRLMAHAG